MDAGGKDYAETKKKGYEKNVLFQEFLNEVGTYSIIDDPQEEKRIVHLTAGIIGRYDKLESLSIKEEFKYFIVWDNADIPVVQCQGSDIKRCLDDIEAVCTKFCLINEKDNTCQLYDW